jgi:ABC-2 type transport system permease protein
MTTAPALTTRPVVPIKGSARWAGLGNLLRKEFGRWWRTRLWWVQALLWLALVAGITTVVMLDSAGMTPSEHVAETVPTFFGVGIVTVGIGAVLTVQGSMIGEKELGTAAWVLSKPVSRASFVVSKIVAHTVGLVVTGVLIPAAAFLVAARYLLPSPFPLGGFAQGLGVFALSVAFYVTLTVALGAFFSGRGPVAGIGIGLILSGQLLKGLFPPSLLVVTPWALADVAASYAIGPPPEWERLVPIVVTVVLTLLLGWAALWRFAREEF